MTAASMKRKKTIATKKLHVLLLVLLLLTTTESQATTITVSNPTPLQRHEVVEVPWWGDKAQSVTVRDVFGIAQPCQLTHDGRLLIFVSVRPNGKATYTVSEGSATATEGDSTATRPWVAMGYHPERMDDIVIENDRGGYRFYGPALQRSGQRGYGIDLWLKNSSEMVVDSLYRLHFSQLAKIDSLRKKGLRREADSVYNQTTFHLNHGRGMDCYNVGPTLGCGAPSLMQGDELLFPWCYDRYEVLDNGPLRITLRLDFAPVSRPSLSEQPVAEHRIVTLDRGSNFCRMQVWYTGLTHPANVCSGFVIHDADTVSVVSGPDYIHYADPTDAPQRQNCQIYVATLYPDGIDSIRRLMYDKPKGGNAGHAIGIHHGLKDGEAFTYYFGAAWSQYDVRSQAEWQLRIQDFLTCRHQPLTVSIQP